MERRQVNIDQIRLGARVRACRTAAGRSRQDLAARLKQSERRIGAIERGAAAITALELWALSDLLNTPITAFFDPPPQADARPPPPTIYDLMASSDDGAALAEAFVKLKAPRLRRHLVQLAQELVQQEHQSGS